MRNILVGMAIGMFAFIAIYAWGVRALLVLAVVLVVLAWVDRRK